MGGINKPKGLIWDPLAKDWILFGELLPANTRLTIDDLAVALRARFNYPKEDPGVTIDPVWATFSEGAQTIVQLSHQEVRFFGPLQDTAFGTTCFDADWLMKRISAGLEQSRVAGLSP